MFYFKIWRMSFTQPATIKEVKEKGPGSNRGLSLLNEDFTNINRPEAIEMKTLQGQPPASPNLNRVDGILYTEQGGGRGHNTQPANATGKLQSALIRGRPSPLHKPR